MAMISMYRFVVVVVMYLSSIIGDSFVIDLKNETQ